MQAVRSVPFLTPMLAARCSDIPNGEAWVHERKYDGYRMQCSIRDGRATLYSRSGLNWSHRFAGLIERLANSVPRLLQSSAVIDAELIASGGTDAGSFAGLQQELKKPDPKLCLVAFDLLVLDGHDLRGQPLSARRRALKELLSGHPQAPIYLAERINEVDFARLRTMDASGVEGLVSKLVDSPYYPGRSSAWRKFKFTELLRLRLVGLESRRKGVTAYLAEQSGDQLRFLGAAGLAVSSALEEALWSRVRADLGDIPVVDIPPSLRRQICWTQQPIAVDVKIYRGSHPLRHASVCHVPELA